MGPPHPNPKWSESKGILSPGAAPVAKTVLIVDDNEFIRQALSSHFNAKQTLRYAQMQRTGERQLKWLSSCFPI
jgi:hypothetical protein